jgi:CBS domain containing-hemolysin-like protein
MDNLLLYYVLIAICILLSAFFTIAEAALLSVNRITLRHLIQQKNELAEKVLLLKDKPNEFINALLVGNNTVNILAASLSANLFIRLVANQNQAVFFSTVAMTILIVVFGETLPKNIGSSNAIKISLLFYYPVKFTITLFTPIVWLLNAIVLGFSKLFHLETKTNSIITSQMELETVIDISQEEGIIEKEERSLIKSIFEFSDTKVYEIMVQRVDVVSVDILDGIDEVLKVIGETGYSRIPVYEENEDNILGIVYTKDIFQALTVNPDYHSIKLNKIIRKADFVPESKKVDELFREMRENKQHMVLAVDEYGGISGLVTLEDILEELVGEIQDEYDTEEPYFRQKEDGSFEIAGNYPIDDLNELLSIEIPTEEVDTISGFLLSELGHIPVVSEKVEFGNYLFTIDQIKGRRILKVLVKKLKEIQS